MKYIDHVTLPLVPTPGKRTTLIIVFTFFLFLQLIFEEKIG